MSQVHARGTFEILRAYAIRGILCALTLLPATLVSAASVSLAWDAVTSASLAGYTVHWGAAPGNYTSQVDVGNTTTHNVSGLSEGATYHFAVTAYDTSGNRSPYSNEVSTTIPAAAPVANFSVNATSGVAPLSVGFTSTSTGTITTFAWTFGDGTTSSSQNPAKTYSTPGTYTVSLTVTGPGGSNTKTSTNLITVSAPADTIAPSAPSGLGATANGTTGINLSWTASTDNVGVTGYRVERCQGSSCTNFAQIGTPTGTTFSDSGLTASTTYRYRVRAADAAGNLSTYSSTASATTDTPPDTTAPGAPGSVVATANGSTGVNLTWAASTDNVGVTGYRVERCQGSSCTNFAQVATPSGTSFSDSGLTESTTYRYRVRAADAAGNLSTYSSTASATTDTPPDTTAPGAPGSLGATANGTTGINLSWTASTDNVGVTGYRVERCQGSSCTNFAQVSTPTGTSFSDGGLTASTTYRYRVRAADAAGNLSTYSSIASATTDTPPDTTAPSAPASLGATANGTTGINLSWTASTDNVGVTGYRVERCQGSSCTNFAQVSTPTGTSFSDGGLTPSTTYRYRVRAADAAGNLSTYSSIASATTDTPPDTTAPGAPSGLGATANGTTGINLSWTASTDNVGVTGYRVERCQGSSCTNFAQVGTPTGTSFSDGGLTASTTYRYRVRAADAAGNLSTYSSTASATTGAAADTAAPSAPSGLAASVIGSSAVNLTWSAATDDVGVVEYRIQRCQGSSSCTNFAQVGTATGTTYGDTGLTASTTYRYRVRAVDAAGNVSNVSNRVSVTTASAADTTPPGAPSNLAASATGSTAINLSWTAATDNVGVTSYRVERCQGSSCTNFAQVGTPTGTSFSDGGLTASTTYRYRVRAEDAAGNLSTYSSTASATTTTAAPVASFTATPVSGTAPLTVNFTSTSSGSITTYAWSFGDGTTSSAQNPAKVYSTTGSFSVALTVTGPGGSHTATQTSYITVASAPATLQNLGLLVDNAVVPGTVSNANGILEPGETVLVAPVWEMTAGGPVTVTASATVSGQGSSAFALGDNHASYGALTPPMMVDCQSATGNCYRLSVGENVKRPALKWGVTFTETLSTGAVVTRNIPIGKTFTDVSSSDMFYPMIESLVWNDVTTGYPDGTFQPSLGVTRWQTAMFVARAAARGSSASLPVSGMVGGQPYNCVSGGASIFTDVPPTDAGCRHLHYLASLLVNVSFGCGSATSACPTAATTRGAMAVLIAGAIAQGGDAGVPMTGTFNDTGSARSYNCAVTGGGHFSDVPSSSSLCRHANYLWARGIVDGYADSTFRPDLALTRGQMAKFVAQAFRLRLE